MPTLRDCCTGGSKARHCEEPLRRSNPDCLRGKSLDCFATLAMTTCMEMNAANSGRHARACPGHPRSSVRAAGRGWPGQARP
ncbi:hypothetical protein CO669_33175 [Bradyrhizobium sp. Y36]|nr:hypothetical protein CO669_33175 [Bradyrhizobium sp. Y36]